MSASDHSDRSPSVNSLDGSAASPWEDSDAPLGTKAPDAASDDAMQDVAASGDEANPSPTSERARRPSQSPARRGDSPYSPSTSPTTMSPKDAQPPIPSSDQEARRQTSPIQTSPRSPQRTGRRPRRRRTPDGSAASPTPVGMAAPTPSGDSAGSPSPSPRQEGDTSSNSQKPFSPTSKSSLDSKDDLELDDLSEEALTKMLRDMIPDYDAERTAIVDDDRKLRDKRMEMEAGISSLKAEKQNIHEYRDKLENSLKCLEMMDKVDLAAVTEELTSAKSKLADDERTYEAVHEAVNMLQAQKDKLQGSSKETTDMRRKVGDERRRLRQKQEGVEKYKAEITINVEDVRILQEKVENDQIKIQRSKADLTVEFSKLEQTKQQFRSHEKSFKKKQGGLDSERRNVKETLILVTEDHARANAEINELIKTVDVLKNKKKRYELMTARFQSLRDEVKDNERERQRMLAGLPASRSDHIATQGSELDEAKRRLEKEEEAITAQQKEMAKTVGNMDEMVGRVAAQKQQIIQYQRDLVSTIAEQQTMRTNLRNAEDQIADARVWSETNARSKIELQKDHMRKKKDSIFKLRGQNQALTKEHRVVVSEADARTAEYNERRAQDQISIVNDETQISLDARVLKEERNELKYELEKVEDEVADIDGEIAHLRKEFDKWDHRDSAIDDAVREIGQRRGEIEIEEGNLGHEYRTLESAAHEARAARDHLQREHNVDSDKLAAWQDGRRDARLAEELRTAGDPAVLAGELEYKDEDTWFETIQRELHRLDTIKIQFATTKLDMEKADLQLEEDELELKEQKRELMGMRRTVEDAGRSLAALKYDVSKQAKALQRSKGATLKVKKQLQQDVAEYEVFCAARKMKDQKNKLKLKEQRRVSDRILDLDKAHNKLKHQQGVLLKKSNALQHQIHLYEDHKDRAAQLEMEGEQLGRDVEHQKLRLDALMQDIGTLDEQRLEMKNICRQKQEDNVAEREKVEEEIRLRQIRRIRDKQSELDITSHAREKKRMRAERMQKTLAELRAERERLLENQKKLSQEEIDVKRQRKKYVHDLTATTAARQDFNRETIHAFEGNPESVQGVRTRMIIDEQKKAVLKLLSSLGCLKDQLEEQRKLVVGLRSRLLDRQNQLSIRERREQIHHERKALQKERRTVIESKKKLRAIIQNICQEKRAYERLKDTFIEARNKRGKQKLSLMYEDQSYNEKQTDHDQMSGEVTNKRSFLRTNNAALQSQKLQLGEKRRQLEDTECQINMMKKFLKEDRDGIESNMRTMVEITQMLYRKVQGVLNPAGMMQLDKNAPSYEVKGAPEEECNGTYFQEKSANGPPYKYHKDDLTYMMEWDPAGADWEAAWYIMKKDDFAEDEDDMYETILLTETADSEGPPNEQWVDCSKEDYDQNDYLTNFICEKIVSEEAMAAKSDLMDDAKKTEQWLQDMMTGHDTDQDSDDREPSIDPTLPEIEREELRRGKRNNKVKAELTEIEACVDKITKYKSAYDKSCHQLGHEIGEFAQNWDDAVKQRKDFEVKNEGVERNVNKLRAEYTVLKKSKTRLMFKKLADRARRVKTRTERRRNAPEINIQDEEATKEEKEEKEVDPREVEMRDWEDRMSRDEEVSFMRQYMAQKGMWKDWSSEYLLACTGVIFEYMKPWPMNMMRHACNDLVQCGVAAFAEAERKRYAQQLLIGDGDNEIANELDKFLAPNEDGERPDTDFDMNNQEDLENASFADIMAKIAMTRRQTKEKEASIATTIAQYTNVVPESRGLVIEESDEDDDIDLGAELGLGMSMDELLDF